MRYPLSVLLVLVLTSLFAKHVPAEQNDRGKFERVFDEVGCPTCEELKTFTSDYLRFVQEKGCDPRKCKSASTLTVASDVSSGARVTIPADDSVKSSIMLSKEKLESLQDMLQVEYQPIGWKILNVSQPLATEIMVSIEVDNQTAVTYDDENGNRVIFGHALMCPKLEEPRWKFIDKDTDVLFLMFHNGRMIYPPDLHTNRMMAGCRFSKSLVHNMIEQGAIQIEIGK